MNSIEGYKYLCYRAISTIDSKKALLFNSYCVMIKQIRIRKNCIKVLSKESDYEKSIIYRFHIITLSTVYH